MEVQHGEWWHFCHDPGCPDPVGKLSTLSPGALKRTKTQHTHDDEANINSSVVWRPDVRGSEARGGREPWTPGAAAATGAAVRGPDGAIRC